MKEDALKMVIAGAAAALMTYAAEVVIPVMVLVFVMLLDYCTGVHAAWVRHELSSRTGLMGILKKLSYLAMVAVACVIDYVLATVGAQLGAVISVRYVSLLAVFWLIINESISILENVAKVGGPVPPFIARLLTRLKGSVEEQLPEAPELPGEGYQPKHERKDGDI